MKRQPIYFYLRSSWKKRRWSPSKFKRLLTHDRELLLFRIEKLLGPPPTKGEHFANSFLRLMYEATAIQNISDDGTRERTFKYKTLQRARGRAVSLVTNRPKLDPDGYAVHPVKGDCLFFNGVTAQELFPSLGQP